MSLGFFLLTPKGGASKFDPRGFPFVSPVTTPPPSGELIREFRENFIQENTDPPITDMRVDGSITPVVFIIKPGNTDRYIKKIIISIAGPAPQISLDKFGGLSALPNGLKVCYPRRTGDLFLDEEVKTNLDLIELAGGEPSFGSGNDAFKVGGMMGGGSAGYMPVVDTVDMFSVPHGFLLRGNTRDIMCVIINDNLSPSANLTRFDMIATGFDLTEIKEK